jgi:hypothetical protein
MEQLDEGHTQILTKMDTNREVNDVRFGRLEKIVYTACGAFMALEFILKLLSK